MSFDFLSYRPPASAAREHAIEGEQRAAARVAAGEPIATITRAVITQDEPSGLLMAGTQALTLQDDGTVDEAAPVVENAPSEAERLAAAQDRQRDAIQAAATAAQVAGIAVPGIGRVKASPDVLLLLNGAVSMATLALQAGQPFEQKVDLIGGGSATLDAHGMIGLGIAVGTGVNAIRSHAQDLTDAVDQAATAEDAAAVDVAGGWPNEGEQANG